MVQQFAEEADFDRFDQVSIEAGGVRLAAVFLLPVASNGRDQRVFEGRTAAQLLATS